MTAGTQAAVERDGRITWTRTLLAILALSAAWALDGLVLRTGLLAPIHGKASWTPLYAVVEAVWRPSALVFAGLGALFVWFAPRTCDPARVSSRGFAILIAAVATSASFALFLVRQDPGDVGLLLDHYRDEEFIHDARSIVDPAAFLGRYVEVMPQLSTHGRHFPPGHALLLHALMQIFGSTALVAGILSLVGVAAGSACAYAAARCVTGETRARAAAWMIVTAPSLLDFGAASMDAVFFALASLALWLGMRALNDGGTTRGAVLAGLTLFVTASFSFSAVMVALALALYALFRAGQGGQRVLVRLAWIATAGAATAFVVWLATGFSIVSCGAEALRSGRAFMETVMSRSTNTDRARLFFGNGAAFALLAGVGTVAAASISLSKRSTWQDPWTRAALVTFAVMCSFYYLETERIWLFALPWIALIAARRVEWDKRSLRIAVGFNALQACAFEIVYFTLW